MKKLPAAIAFVAFAASLGAFAQSTPAGVWRTYDDGDGLPASLVRIEERNGLFEGRVLKLLPRPGHDVNAKCTACEGDDKDKPIAGMRILWDMQRDGDEFSGGKIFDPDSGNTYRCKLRLTGDKLSVRGFLGISLFGRSQVWVREQ